MGGGSEEDEDVPDGMKMLAAVVGEKIRTHGVEEAFGKDGGKGEVGETLINTTRYEQAAPAHEKVQAEREARPLAYGNNFVYGSKDDKQPLESEDKPTLPAAHDTYAHGSVGAGYHNVDADVVALAQGTLYNAWTHHVVYGAGQEHEKHACNKENDAHGHLPSLLRCRPDEPNAAESKDNTCQMCPGVAVLEVYFLHIRTPVSPT